MTVDEAADRLRQRMLEAGFDCTRPDPRVAWSVFQGFAAEPVESAGGPGCEELWFEACDGDPVSGSPAFFDFVRQFLQDTEAGAEWHEQITAHFTSEPGVRLGLGAVIHAADLADLPAFFRAVEGSEAFRAGQAFAGWSFEVRVDAC